jgi:hypothetical protein
MISFFLDPAFEDFNFCESWDPALRVGPSSANLYELIYKARQGSRVDAAEFAETMAWTLRPETWECFQRTHGHRPASHRDWFYAKLMQYFNILLYDELTVNEANGHTRKLKPDELLTPNLKVSHGNGPLIQPDELEESLVAEKHAEYPWFGLVQQILSQPDNRLGAAQAWLRDQMAPTDSIAPQRSGWTKNEERDQIIVNLLNRGVEPASICEELDLIAMQKLPSMKAKGVHRWKEGWANPQTRNAIQQLFSKVRKRKTVVKPSAISK